MIEHFIIFTNIVVCVSVGVCEQGTIITIRRIM